MVQDGPGAHARLELIESKLVEKEENMAKPGAVQVG